LTRDATTRSTVRARERVDKKSFDRSPVAPVADARRGGVESTANRCRTDVEPMSRSNTDVATRARVDDTARY